MKKKKKKKDMTPRIRKNYFNGIFPERITREFVEKGIKSFEDLDGKYRMVEFFMMWGVGKFTIDKLRDEFKKRNLNFKENPVIPLEIRAFDLLSRQIKYECDKNGINSMNQLITYSPRLLYSLGFTVKNIDRIKNAVISSGLSLNRDRESKPVDEEFLKEYHGVIKAKEARERHQRNLIDEKRIDENKDNIWYRYDLIDPATGQLATIRSGKAKVIEIKDGEYKIEGFDARIGTGFLDNGRSRLCSGLKIFDKEPKILVSPKIDLWGPGIIIEKPGQPI